jgi:hypothetical protein
MQGSSIVVTGLAGEDDIELRWCKGMRATGWSQLQRVVAWLQEKGKREGRRVGWAGTERERLGRTGPQH